MGTTDAGRHDERPWERAGVVRRDCEPHRGDVLLRLGKLSRYAALAAVPATFPAVLAVGLAVTVLVLVRRDRGRMEWGEMDPAGAEELRKARYYAREALDMCVMWVGILAAIVISILICRAMW